MKRLASCAFALLAGCASTSDDQTVPAEAVPLTAIAQLRDSTGRSVGTASVAQVGDSMRLKVDAIGLPNGSHGLHIHQTGICSPPGFQSAGGHWNPSEAKHGKDNPDGMHKGDLPNLLIGSDGSGSLEYTIPEASMDGGTMPLLDGDGAALVIHASPDDYRTDPSGNSGSRIACGAFR